MLSSRVWYVKGATGSSGERVWGFNVRFVFECRAGWKASTWAAREVTPATRDGKLVRYSFSFDAGSEVTLAAQ